MFQSSRPAYDTELPRASDFRRRKAQAGGEPAFSSTLQSTLEPSLLQDLQRFEEPGNSEQGLEVLEVVAAAVRHGRPLRVMLDHRGVVLPMTVMPVQQLVHAPLPLSQWGLLRWATLKVLQVEAADDLALLLQGRTSQGAATAAPAISPDAPLAPLSSVLWALALQGARAELLPEIAGPVAYRMAPGTDLSALDLGGALGSAVTRLRRGTHTLAEMSLWPGLDRERAMRLLNGLYLQAGLMVSRAHPAGKQ
jgi:hypothetical protein